MRTLIMMLALVALGACNDRGVGFSCGAGANYCEDGAS